MLIADAELTAPVEGAATTTAESASAEAHEVQPADAGAAPAKPSILQSLGPMPMILILFALFYFMMIRPQQRKEKERRKMIEELRAGARVVFAGGIVGTIVEAREKSFKIETAPGVTMEVLRSSVQGIAETEAAAAK